jgi:hypothetical protein
LLLHAHVLLLLMCLLLPARVCCYCLQPAHVLLESAHVLLDQVLLLPGPLLLPPACSCAAAAF